MPQVSFTDVPKPSTAKILPFFAFETNFDEESFVEWIRQNWTLCFWFSALYVVFIFGGQYYMKKRPRFDLRGVLALWSAALGIFSILAAVRSIPVLSYILHRHGFEFSLCQPTNYAPGEAFWGGMFVISKVLELGDTAFIVLRKQKLIFLHWYHHIITMVYVWYSYSDMTGTGLWFCAMNYTVHAFMYSYYTLRALRIHIPRPIGMCITSLQIAQMLMGTFVSVRAYQIKTSGVFCHPTMRNMQYSLMIYASYLILFANFFYNAYLKPKQPTPQGKELTTKRE